MSRAIHTREDWIAYFDALPDEMKREGVVPLHPKRQNRQQAEGRKAIRFLWPAPQQARFVAVKDELWTKFPVDTAIEVLLRRLETPHESEPGGEE